MTAPAGARFNRGSVITLGTLASDVAKVASAPGAPAMARTVPIVPNAQALSDPTMIHRYLIDIEARLHRIGELLGTDILGGGNLIRNVAMTANTVNTFAHRLGRTYIGFVVTHARPTGAWSPPYSPVFDMALPNNFSADKYISLECSWTGTIDVYVF